MGGRGGEGGRRVNSRFSEDEWESWSQDPSIYQRLERGEDLSEDFDDQGIYDEYEDYVNRAKKMQTEAETQTVSGRATLYRGERFNSLEEAEKVYSKGKTVTTKQLTSYSTDKNMAQDYARMYSGKVAVVIENTNKAGNFVGVQANHYGYKAGKDPEVIVKRGLESKVVSTRYDKSTNTLYVKMSNETKRKKRR